MGNASQTAKSKCSTQYIGGNLNSSNNNGGGGGSSSGSNLFATFRIQTTTDHLNSNNHSLNTQLNSSSSSTNNSNSNNINISSHIHAATIPANHKVTIPFDRWIKNDCRKWGHFKDFDFYSINTNTNNNNNNNNNNNGGSSANNNIIITINNQNINALALDSSNNHNNTNNNENNNNNNNNNISNSYLLSTYVNNCNQSNNITILSSFLSNDSSSSSSSSNKNLIFNSHINNNNQRLQLHYVNGYLFKPIERLGDSQFILSQIPYNDIIVTVPCNIGRYKQNDKNSKETANRLNRVIGVCEKYIIFQIWKGNNEVEIFIYEFNKNDLCVNINNNNNSNNSTSNNSTISCSNNTSNRIVRKLNRRFNSRTYASLISPDRNCLLITPDYEFNYSYSHHTHSHAESTIIINIVTNQLLRVIPARCDQRFAFDPRYGAPNHPAPRFAEFDTVRGQIFDLSLEKVIVCSNHTLKTKVFRVEYTKDGYLIIVICTLPVFHRRARRNYFIYILNSSTLLHMRSIIDYRGPLLTTYMFSNDFNLLFNMYPSLSNCASSIAVLKNIEPSMNTRVIELYTLPNVCSMSLKELCRRVILRHVDSKHLNRLPLPPKLISYLSFNNNNIYVNNSNTNHKNNNMNNMNNINRNVYNTNSYNQRRNMIVSNIRRSLTAKCSSLQSRLSNNKRSIANFLLQIKNSNR